MSAAVVWLDHQSAKIYRLLPGKMESEQVKSHGTKGGNKDALEERYFHDLAKHLSNINEILLMGPGSAKQEFLHHLQKHHHKAIADNVVGVETVDHPSDAQVLERARTFFKKYDMYE